MKLRSSPARNINAVISVLHPLWTYRSFIVGSVARDFQSKYRQSMLGAAWTVINPLAMISVYTLIFSHLMQARFAGLEGQFSYSLYLCAGVLTWGLFSEIMSRSQTMFIDNANLLKKVNFPILCMPLTVLLSAMLNFLIIFGIFSIVLIVLGRFPGLIFILMIPLTIVLVAFASALGAIIGLLNVFFRDVGHVSTLGLTFWFWLTPIVYPLSILPASAQNLIYLNPLTGWVSAVQDIIVFSRAPHWLTLAPIIVSTVILILLGQRLYSKLSSDMMDEL